MPTHPPHPGGAGNPKLQRWVDLLAALLVRVHPATFDELAGDVPEYWRKRRAAEQEADPKRRQTGLDSLKRTFERDKDELRAFGVPIESVPDEHGNTGGAYRLRRTDFYLPYLCFAMPDGGTSAPERPDRWGYQALASLTFEPDELRAVVDAAACVRALGDPLLAADAASALRKLAVDLPLDGAAGEALPPDVPRVVLPRARADAALFELLGDALARRKRVRFAYHAMSTDRTEVREVEPYGLFFLNGHWYLAARDLARRELRNFRLNRIADATVNTARANSADYEVPPDFHLRAHARSRQAWELGGGDAMAAVVEFRGHSGPARAAAKLGAPVEACPERRAFEVRRLDAFVRWLLSFAGEAVPVAPAELVERYRTEARRAAGLYESERDGAGHEQDQETGSRERERGPGSHPASAFPVPGSAGAPPEPHDGAAASPDHHPSTATRSPSSRGATASPAGPAASPPTPWQPRGAAAQLRRILHVIPRIADGEEHPLAEVAARVGTDAATLRRDLHSLVTRFDEPAGFVEGVSVYLEPDRVSAFSNHLLRPMRLTASELCALELGLAVLHARRPPEEQRAIERARGRLEEVIARLPGDPIPDGVHGASLGDHGSTAHLAAVRRALRERRQLRLTYRKSGSPAAADRVVCPYALVAASGTLYVVAYCEDGDGVRVFRMDRVEDAEPLPATFEPRADFSLDAMLRDGRVFHRPEAGTMRVRYSPRVARWIAEREGRVPDADGALELEHPLADEAWGMRHVLQYGAEAELLAPEALRAKLGERLRAMARA